MPAVHALGDFGERLGPPSPGQTGSVQAALSGLMRRYRPGVVECVGWLHIDGRSVTLRAGDTLEIEDEPTGDPLLRPDGAAAHLRRDLPR